jgi:uncharacterized membrane protein
MNEHENSILFSKEDIEKNKVISALAYFIFFLPLIVCNDSPFGKFHANQGLLLFITCVIGNIVLEFIPLIGWILLPLFSLFILILAIIGLVNTLNGNANELPIIGKFTIIK